MCNDQQKNYEWIIIVIIMLWGQAAGYHPRPQAADRGTTFRYEG